VVRAGKKKFELCGEDADVAVAAISRREKSLEGLTVLDDKESKGRVVLSAAIVVYVDDAADGKKAHKTYSAGRSRPKTDQSAN
jgi:hypothetical protein